MMPTVAVFSVKGGTGATLVAANLGIACSSVAPTLLVDLHPRVGSVDLLLSLTPTRSWADLLPVAAELLQRHLSLAVCKHSSGLAVLTAPNICPGADQMDHLPVLLQQLASYFAWLILDVPPWIEPRACPAFVQAERLLMVTTPDPPALRAARRARQALGVLLSGRAALVVNQINSQHPLAPERLADALEIPLIAALPPDPRAIGYQVNFGEPCVAQHGSHFGRGIMRLAQRLRQDAARLTSAQADAPALAGSSLVGRQGRSNVRE